MTNDPVITPEIESLFSVAIDLHIAGNFEGALASYRRCIEACPSLAPAWGNAGRCLAGLGRHVEAIAAYAESCRLDGHSAEFFVHKALSHQMLGDAQSARHELTTALAVDPNHLNALNALGNLELNERKLASAGALYTRALEVAASNPTTALDAAITLNNLGALNRAEGNLSGAANAYKSALDLDPANAATMSNLATVYLDMAQHKEMLTWYEKALIQGPDRLLFANTLMGLLYPDGIDPVAIRSRHEQWVARFCPVGAQAQAFSDARTPWVSPDGVKRRLRIGYLSSDFREHALFKFLHPVLRNHSTDVELFIYANVLRPDRITKQYQAELPRLQFVTHLSDAQLNALIRSDELDILVELNGHTEGNRLAALAVKPAPVVCTWLGYPATTGMRSIDYRLVDKLTDPEGLDALCTEKLIRLDRGFNCYEPIRPLPDESALPLLKNGYVTFGSASNARKLSTQTLSAWASVLQAIPTARLSLKSASFDDAGTRAYVSSTLAALGVAPTRVSFLGHEPGEDIHLRFYNGVDIALDTFPYNGTTTTCDALIMGVPVITLRGNAHVSRVSFSILERLGLGELASENKGDFVAVAQRLAADTARLESLRRTLRARFQASPLGQHKHFVQELERVYRRLCGAPE